MKYRRVGNSGLKVSEIGLGSWLTYGTAADQAAAETCIKTAYELGINFFDTANAYNRGEGEKAMGAALKPYSRSSYVLSTKVFFPMDSGPNDRGLSRKHIMEQCEASLKRLGTDYIDIYFCHRYDSETPLEETLRALAICSPKARSSTLPSANGAQPRSPMQQVSDGGSTCALSSRTSRSIICSSGTLSVKCCRFPLRREWARSCSLPSRKAC